MSVKKNIFLVSFVLAFAFGQAQEFKFGKVSKEEIEQKNHPLEAEAEAAILYKKEWVQYNYSGNEGFTTTRYAHYRIKVYDKSGLDWGTLEVPLYTSRNGEERISSVKGYTYNIANGKIVETKLRKDGIFKENVNKYRNKTSIVLPEVKEGSVIEVEYKITSDFAANIDDFQVQYGIPVNQVEVSLEIPEYYIFKKYSRGFYPIDIKQSKKNRKMQVQYRVENDPGRLNGGNRSSNLEFFENVYKINTKNIPSLKDEDYTDNIDNYRSAIKFELASTRFPNTIPKNYSLTWEDVAKSIYEYDNFGGELKKSNVLKNAVEKIKSEIESEDQLASSIYSYLQNHMTWNGYRGVGSENGLKKAYEQKKGNVGDINLMLTSMLRYGGYKANPVLVSTKSNGIPLFPTQDGFNYVICALEDSNGMVLLDATEKMAPMGILPSRVLNWNGRLIRKDGTSNGINLVPEIAAKSIISMNAEIKGNGSVEGKLRKQLFNNHGFNYRKNHKDQSTEDIMGQMEELYEGIEVENLEIKNRKLHHKPLVESCDFQIENQTENIGNKIYFQPALFLASNENPFKEDQRDFPIDFEYPKLSKMSVNYRIPDGYKIESVPKGAAMALPEKMGNFKYIIKQDGNTIQFVNTITIKRAIIPANYYPALKEFFSQIVTKHSERVVLSKISTDGTSSGTGEGR